MADELVPIGRVGKPHGLDGAFVVERPSSHLDRFVEGATLFVAGELSEVVASRRVGGGRLAIRLDRPVARGAVLAVPRADLPVPEEGHYYAFQLVGLRVVDRSGRPLGRVDEVLPGPANDNLELDSGTLVPMIEDAVVEIDFAVGRIVVDGEFLALG